MSTGNGPPDGPALASLGSGSKGNGTLVRLGDQLLLVDCGFTLKQVEFRLNRLGLRGGDLTGIFVSHEHSDHISGVAGLAHKYRLPIYASYGTAAAREIGLKVQVFDAHAPLQVGDVDVRPVVVPHDAREPTQFVFEHAGSKVGVLSDIGSLTPHVIESFTDCRLLLLESNHDLEMLARGRYPERLKRRVGGDHGHLNNQQAAWFLEQVANDRLKVMLGHVSQQNNDPSIVDEVFEPLRDSVADMVQACQDYGGEWLVDTDQPVAASSALASSTT